MSPGASFGVRFGFAALAVSVAALFAVGNVWASRRLDGDRRTVARVGLLAVVGTAIWMAATGAAASSGLLARFDLRPPPMLVLFVAMLVVSAAIGFSRVGARLARGLPIAVLIGVHAFRLVLELLMHRAAREGVMPARMSYSGWNFDIVTGATAIVVAILAGAGRAPRALVVMWNIVGIVLLGGIVGIAMASTPMIHAFGSEPQELNTFVVRLPFVWLPSVLVVTAMVGHIVLSRRLLADRA